MSYIQVKINNQEVTKRVISIDGLNEYNDESRFFSGVFRFNNLVLTLDNNNNLFDAGSVVFPDGRNNITVELFYISNDERLDPYLVFRGTIDEGSTEENLKTRNLSLTVMDSLKNLRDVVIKTSDINSIESLYSNLFGTKNVKMDKGFIACFLYNFLSKDNNKLNNIFNVFENNNLAHGTYDSINSTIESIFPPSDSYYLSNNVSALNIFQELCRGTNSYSYVENNLNESKLFVKPRPSLTLSTKNINLSDIISIENKTDGFNKLINSVTINSSEAFVNQASIDNYGARVLNINSYAAPTQALADSYLNYYKDPKIEFSLIARMNNKTLDLKIGDKIEINVISNRNFTLKGITGTYFVISRTINFKSDTIVFYLREL